MKELKKVAVIGYGGQGGWHADQILRSDVVELAGVYDIKKERRELAKSKGIKVYPSLNKLLDDPEVEIVVIATPNDSHKKLVIRALEAGKHVICEKPVELSVAAFDKMQAAAERCGKCFSVHQNRRWDVDYLGMKKIITEGRLGDIVSVESRIHGSRGIPSDWRGKKKYGGGMLYDWGVHLIDQMLLLFDGHTIDTVDCRLIHTTNFEVDDGFKLTITFDNGATGYVEVGTLNFIAMPRFYLQCMKGTALITNWQKPADVVFCKHWHESDVLPVQTAAGITKTMAHRDSVTVDTYQEDIPVSDVHDFYRNFCAAIDGREEQIVRPEQVRRVLRVIEKAFASAKKKRPVKFGE